LPVEDQKKAIINAIERWKKNGEQTDDIMVIGIRLR